MTRCWEKEEQILTKVAQNVDAVVFQVTFKLAQKVTKYWATSERKSIA